MVWSMEIFKYLSLVVGVGVDISNPSPHLSENYFTKSKFDCGTTNFIITTKWLPTVYSILVYSVL